MIKSRGMKWVAHVADMGDRRGAYRVLVRKPEGKRPLGNLSVDWRLILTHILKKSLGCAWTGLIWLRIGKTGGLLLTR
jgi:hypothetical protein